MFATDAPLLPIQLDRISQRAALAVGRTGSIGMDGSGYLFIAFSTGNRLKFGDSETKHISMITDINPLFEATVQSTEESIINALIAGETMVGVDGNTIFALPHKRLQMILRKYNRLKEKVK